MQGICKAIILVVVLASCLGFGWQGHQKEETYTVLPGDTLWSIGEKFIVKNDYSRRDPREFVEGIYQHNFETVFMDREKNGWARPKEIFPGDQLRIVYWTKEEKPE
jgi:hypothetical protein